MHLTYKHTKYACYAGYITQAIINNLAPLLFIIFQTQYGLNFEMVGRLILINFGTQILADLIAVKFADRFGYRFPRCWLMCSAPPDWCCWAFFPRSARRPMPG